MFNIIKKYKESTGMEFGTRTLFVTIIILILTNIYTNYRDDKTYRKNMDNYIKEYYDDDVLSLPNDWITNNRMTNTVVSGKILKEYMEKYNISIIEIYDRLITIDGRTIKVVNDEKKYYELDEEVLNNDYELVESIDIANVADDYDLVMNITDFSFKKEELVHGELILRKTKLF